MTSRGLRGLGLVALIVGASSLLRDDGITHGQQPEKKDPAAIGVAACALCHTNGPVKLPVPDDEKADPLPVMVLQKEIAIWGEKDLHQFAFAALSRDLGKRMNEKWEARYKRPVTKSAECLACHAVDKHPGNPEWTMEKRVAAGDGAYLTKEGVSCEACHGLGGAPWVDAHWKQRIWRDYTPDQKRKLGITDLRDPEVRATKCASCHIGNVQEGKFVTHEMYAMGHPPLQPFELLTYSEYEPAHWLKPVDVPMFQELAKTPAGQKKLENFHLRAGLDSDARLFAVGNLYAFRESMRLLADASEAANKATKDEDKVLDFAHFDCASCHHDLRFPGWRQKRGYEGVPGRPPRKQWLGELIDVVLVLAPEEERKNLQTLKAELAKAVSDKVFGDPKTLLPAAKKGMQWADGVAKKVNETGFAAKSDARQKLLAKIDSALQRPKSDSGLVDYDAACQLVWARDRLSTTGKFDATAKPDKTKVGLPPLHLRYFEPKRLMIDTLLPGRLDNAREYDPEEFYKAMGGGKGKVYAPLEAVPDETPKKK